MTWILGNIKMRLNIAMYLDPRFKAMSFLDNTTKDQVRHNVKMELIDLIEHTTEESPQQSCSKEDKAH